MCLKCCNTTLLFEWLKRKKKLTITNAGEDKEQQELSFIGDGIMKWQSNFRKEWQTFIKSNKGLLYNPAITLLGIYPRYLKTYIHRKSV